MLEFEEVVSNRIVSGFNITYMLYDGCCVCVNTVEVSNADTIVCIVVGDIE